MEKNNPLTDDPMIFCSFCGKNRHEVRTMIAGPGVYICDECVELCSEIVEEQTASGATVSEVKSLYESIIELRKTTMKLAGIIKDAESVRSVLQSIAVDQIVKSES